jgi:hypothetical protein
MSRTPIRLSNPRKYRNQPQVVDGLRFDSKKECDRWQHLKLLERIGEITGLERQRRFLLEVNGQKICEYVSDFDYFDKRGDQVVEDVKSAGTKTAVYRLKKRLMKVLLSIEITEV